MDPIVLLNKKFLLCFKKKILLNLVNHNNGLDTVSHNFSSLLGNRGTSKDSSPFLLQDQSNSQCCEFVLAPFHLLKKEKVDSSNSPRLQLARAHMHELIAILFTVLNAFPFVWLGATRAENRN